MATETMMVQQSEPKEYFYSTKVCYCGFSMFIAYPENWFKKTGCPQCRRSFVD